MSLRPLAFLAGGFVFSALISLQLSVVKIEAKFDNIDAMNAEILDDLALTQESLGRMIKTLEDAFPSPATEAK